MLHISTALVYLVDPSKISKILMYFIKPGARYHLVATYSVSTGTIPSFSFIDTNLAKPKSASLALHSEFKSILDGLRSL